VFNKKSFGVYSLVGGEQVVVKRGNDTVLRFDDNENTEVSAVNDVKIESRDGDVSLVSASGKIRIMGAVEFGGSDLAGTIANSMGSTGSGGLLSALSVVNGTVKLAAPNIVHEGRTDFNGTFTVGNGDIIQLGWDSRDEIDVRGTIYGRTALMFGGTEKDNGHKISFNVVEPTKNYTTILIPDNGGTLVVEAVPPLRIATNGSVILDQWKITTVGALQHGSILPTFGDINIERSNLTAGTLTVRNTTRLEGRGTWGKFKVWENSHPLCAKLHPRKRRFRDELLPRRPDCEQHHQNSGLERDVRRDCIESSWVSAQCERPSGVQLYHLQHDGLAERRENYPRFR